MGCSHPTTSEELTYTKNQLGEREGGRAHLGRWLPWPLKTQRDGFSSVNAADPIPYFPNEPINSFAGDFPFRSLLGQALLFATTLCGGKRTVEKRKASSWQQLLCGKESLSVQLWQFSRNLGSQGTRVRGTPGRGTHKPRICFYFLSISLVSPQLPLPAPQTINTNLYDLYKWVVGGGTFSSSKIRSRIQPPY